MYTFESKSQYWLSLVLATSFMCVCVYVLLLVVSMNVLFVVYNFMFWNLFEGYLIYYTHTILNKCFCLFLILSHTFTHIPIFIILFKYYCCYKCCFSIVGTVCAHNKNRLSSLAYWHIYSRFKQTTWSIFLYSWWLSLIHAFAEKKVNMTRVILILWNLLIGIFALLYKSILLFFIFFIALV